MSVWGNPCWGVTLCRLLGPPAPLPPSLPPPPSSSAFKRPDDALSHAGPAVPQAPRSHPRGPALPRLFGAPAVLSPSYRPAFRHRFYRLGTQVHPSRRHPFRTTATPARYRPADAPERRPHLPTQPTPGANPRADSASLSLLAGPTHGSPAPSCRVPPGPRVTAPSAIPGTPPPSPTTLGNSMPAPLARAPGATAPALPACRSSRCATHRTAAVPRHDGTRPGPTVPPPACPGPRMKSAATPLGSGRRSWQSCPCRPSFHGNRSPRSLPPRPPNRRQPRPPNRLHRPPTDQLRLPRQNR